MNDRIPERATALSRRAVMAVAAGAAAAALSPSRPIMAQTASASILTRPIPRSGEMLPAVGVGTWQVFDVGDSPEKSAALRPVIEALVAGGGKVIDTASAYGSSEAAVGHLVRLTGLRDQLFLATKCRVGSRASMSAEMQQSQRRLESQKIDLMQLHNVRDLNTDLGLFREWKAQGICRYFGITTSFNGDHTAVGAVAAREKPDFVQVNYSIAERAAESRVLPAAKDAGAAVLINEPFASGRLFRRVRGKPLPDWAAEFDAASWGQFFLKFILAYEAVTVVIPGTAKTEHMKDNLAAGRGKLPDRAMRARMVAFVDAL